MSTSTDPQFELRFESLFERDCYVFPCDAKGHVDLDALSERDLNNYLYARHAIGREVARPAVCASRAALIWGEPEPGSHRKRQLDHCPQ